MLNMESTRSRWPLVLRIAFVLSSGALLAYGVYRILSRLGY
jgi:hypothetical protein